MKRLLLLSLLVLGCDKEIERSTGLPFVADRVISCHYFGYCYDCNIDLDDEYTCGYRLTNSCDGRQNAKVQVTPIQAWYESGATRKFEETQIVKLESPCR